uniref:Uncharacterized protein n=1 Tax=Oryza barthii TaxID=65489 RepID=A0A0D3ELD4_9ORYZ
MRELETGAFWPRLVGSRGLRVISSSNLTAYPVSAHERIARLALQPDHLAPAPPPALGAAARPSSSSAQSCPATSALPSAARHRSARTPRLHGRAMPSTALAASVAYADLAPPRLRGCCAVPGEVDGKGKTRKEKEKTKEREGAIRAFRKISHLF